MPRSSVKHLNPRQGITTVRRAASRSGTPLHCVKHLNPRQGITSVRSRLDGSKTDDASVKHLNPRQGITTRRGWDGCSPTSRYRCVKHLNPRQGITTGAPSLRRHLDDRRGVKHLNPRQGITTSTPWPATSQIRLAACVKHLNPRQGITTARSEQTQPFAQLPECETPKSPPGDYNSFAVPRWRYSHAASVKHLNPRQGITTRMSADGTTPRCRHSCETPKSPPGDYNIASHAALQSPRNSV